MKCNKNTFRLTPVRVPSASRQYHHSQFPCAGEALEMEARIRIYDSQRISCVTLGLLYNLSERQFSCLQNGH